MSKTLALYMRLSSEDGTVGESDSISNQRDLLRRFVESKPEFNGCEILEFQDDGFSGTNFNRPQVKRMLLMVRQKRIQCVIVKDFSRFGRNYVDVCDYLEQVFPIYGVRFLSVTDNYDSDRTKGSSVGMDVALKSMIHEIGRIEERYTAALEHCNSLEVDRDKRLRKSKELQAFITMLKKQPLVVSEWDERLWITLLDTATVQRDGEIVFRFKCGRIIEI